MLAVPPLRNEGSFSGTVLNSYATTSSAEEERQIQPFVENLSEDNVLKVGFDTRVQASEDLTTPVAVSNLRKLRHVNMFNEVEHGFEDVYDIMDSIEVEMTSTHADDDAAPPLKVQWSMQSSTETSMELKLNLAEISADIDITDYDNLQVTFNNPELFKPVEIGSTKVLPVGKSVEWSMNKQMKREYNDTVSVLSQSLFSLVCLVIASALVLAAFKGSLLTTWMFVNTM